MGAILDIQDVHKTFRLGDATVHALAGVTLSAEPGRFIAIMGASGSGKSTLLHLIGGLDTPDSGAILVEDNNIARMSDRQRTLFRRRRMGIIFQTYNLLPNLSARENIAIPLLVDGAPAGKISERVGELIHTVHLEARAQHRPQAMSGGEQQRVHIARALINDQALTLAYEPTGKPDSVNAAEIWTLLRQLADVHGKTVLMVTHEAIAASYADTTYVIKDGKLVGTIEGTQPGDAALVAHRYAELVG